jgi:hypothetical protein
MTAWGGERPVRLPDKRIVTTQADRVTIESPRSGQRRGRRRRLVGTDPRFTEVPRVPGRHADVP